MKTSLSRSILFIGVLFVLSAWHVKNAEAQVNEARVLRQASGVYEGRLQNSKRVRTDPHNGTVTTLYGVTMGKTRVPVTENNFKTAMSDDDLDGNGKAKFSGDGKTANVKQGGKKIAYVVKKGVMDTLQDGHQPIKKGTARGGMVRRGSKWVASLSLRGKRVDNDGYISTFSADADGKH